MLGYVQTGDLLGGLGTQTDGMLDYHKYDSYDDCHIRRDGDNAKHFNTKEVQSAAVEEPGFGGIIVCESPADKELPELQEPYRLRKSYRYGKIKISVFTKEPQD